MEDFILHKDKTIVKIPLSKVYYVTTHATKPHVVVFVTLDGEYDATMSLPEVENISSGELDRCYREHLVNKSKIFGFDSAMRAIMFIDKGVSDINCSRRCFARLKDEWKKNKRESK